MHGFPPGAKRVVGIDILEASEAVIHDSDGSFNNCAVSEALNVSKMNLINAGASFWTGTVARNALAVLGLLFRRTGPDTGAVVLEKVLGTLSDTRGAIRVLPVWVYLPGISRRIVSLHWRTFQRADSVVHEAFAGQAVALLRSGAASSAEEMAAFSRLGAKTPPLPTLRRAISFGKLLAVLRTLSPAALDATRVAGWTRTLWGGEIVNVDVL